MFSVAHGSRRLLAIAQKRGNRRAISSAAPLRARLYGQPSPKSHPHLLKPMEITPGITRKEYAQRRQKLMDLLPDDSVVISVAGNVKFASQNIFYKFRQASDFSYLTGVSEPESAVILEKTSQSDGCRMTLFVRERDPSKELWDGPRTGVTDAAAFFGADEARDIKTFSSHVKAILPSYSNIYLDAPKQNSTRRRSILQYLSSSSSDIDSLLGSLITTKVRSLSQELHKLRRLKSGAEIELMKRAAALSGSAHSKTMRFTGQASSESALAAHFEYLCALKGSERPAYVPVVASGSNALVIHYTANDHLLRTGDLVLMDAGCELKSSCVIRNTDSLLKVGTLQTSVRINSLQARTWPVSGIFTPPQRDLYQAVLNTLKAVTPLAAQSEGHTLHSLHRISADTLRRELNQIGFRATLRDVERLYPHFLSHPLGMDLHESGTDSRTQELTSGMVITIEPGVYVPPESSFPKEFHNIGIRIEDEVLVQDDHVEVLTVNAPKEVPDVEGACQGLLDNSPYWG